MKCNQKGCYWEFKCSCVSENLQEHYDEKEDFRLSPNTKSCEGYLDYFDFCGREKYFDLKLD